VQTVLQPTRPFMFGQDSTCSPRAGSVGPQHALSEKLQKELDIVAACAACRLATRETKKPLLHDEELIKETNEALAVGGLKVEASQNIRHMAEVLIEDFGYDELGKHVKNPLDRIKIACK